MAVVSLPGEHSSFFVCLEVSVGVTEVSVVTNFPFQTGGSRAATWSGQTSLWAVSSKEC